MLRAELLCVMSDDCHHIFDDLVTSPGQALGDRDVDIRY
jgi:hypothetical protein